MSTFTAIRIGGVELAAGVVEATGTIRHGRGGVDDEPTSSTASVTLIGHGWPVGLETGQELELDADDEPRFRGVITDLAIGWAGAKLAPTDPVLGELVVTAAGNLARISRRKIGYGDWPAETWAERADRIMAEADWTAYTIDPLFTPFGVMYPPDYPLAARAAGETTVHAALEDLAITGNAAIVDTPDGTILLSCLEARNSAHTTFIDLEPGQVLYAPDWSQSLDVVNSVAVAYGPEADSHTVTSRNVESVELYGERTADVASTYADADAAAARGEALVRRRGFPRWQLPGCTVLGLFTPYVGQQVVLSGLPDDAPAPQSITTLPGRVFRPYVEGWVDQLDPPELWTTTLVLSHPASSGAALIWQNVPVAAFEWRTPAAASRWLDAYTQESMFRGPA